MSTDPKDKEYQETLVKLGGPGPFYEYGGAVFRLSEVVRACHRFGKKDDTVIWFRTSSDLAWSTWPEAEWKKFVQALQERG